MEYASKVYFLHWLAAVSFHSALAFCGRKGTAPFYATVPL